MTISLDASTSSEKDRSLDAGTSHSFSHTVGTTTSAVLFLVCVTQSATGADQSGFSATYNSVAMTSIGEISYTSKYMAVSAFYLAAPAAGSNTVAIAWTGSAGGLFVARSYYGVNRGAPVRTSSWQTTTGTGNPSITVPSSTMDVILDGMAGYAAGSATGTGHSALYGPGGGASNYVGHVPSPSSTSVAVSWTVGNYFAQGGFSIQAAGAGGPAVSPFLSF